MKELAMTLALFAALTVAACNTVSGAGDDLKSASNAVENELDK